ncbi:MAG: hypothetical protein M1831_007497 [Alyxoria varia]|nr:MAG: hypothetical protein M1831_007497 [Alyxoria varia]
MALLPNAALAAKSNDDTPTSTSSSTEPVVSLLMFNLKQQPLSATVVAAERPAGPTTFQIRCNSPDNPSLCSLKGPTTVRLTPGKSYHVDTIHKGDQVSYDCKLKSQQPLSCSYTNGDDKETFQPGVTDEHSYFLFPMTVTRGAKMLGKLPQEMSEDDNTANVQTPTSTAGSSGMSTMGATQAAINGASAEGAAAGYQVDLKIAFWLTSAAALGAFLIAA